MSVNVLRGHSIWIHEAEVTHADGGQIPCHFRPDGANADQRNGRVSEARLAAAPRCEIRQIHALDLETFVYVLTQDFNEFLKVRQELLLRILDEVERAGTALAYPTQESINYSTGEVGARR